MWDELPQRPVDGRTIATRALITGLFGAIPLGRFSTDIPNISPVG